MARSNFKLALSATMADIFTAGADVDTIVMGFQITNIDGTNAADATADWTDASDSNTATLICSETEVAAGDAIAPLAAPLMLSPGDKLRAKASAASDLVAFGWVEELDQ